MYREYMSEYLIDGYKKSQFDLENVQFHKGGVTADLQDNMYEDTSNFAFHVSAINIYVAIQQLGILYGAKVNNMKENRKEVLLKTANMTFEKMLTQKNVKVILSNIIERKRTDKYVVYYGQFDIADGASSGNCIYMQLI